MVNTVGNINISSYITKSKKLGVFGAFIALFLIASLISPFFLRISNLINVIRQIAIVGVISIGMTNVILTGGIDLSVGSILAVTSVTSATLFQSGMPVFPVVAIGLMIGIILGTINGIGIAYGSLPPFIMTLGTMVAARGLAMILSGGQPVSWSNTETEFEWLGNDTLLSLPWPVWIFSLVVIIMFFILKYTPFGRYIYSIGDSKEAARLCGINTRQVEMFTYTISGLMCSIAALVYVSRLGVGEPTAGSGVELDAIAMVIIGGTSINGGEGSVLGTVVGAAIIAVIANILNLLGISPFIQQIVKGSIIVLAVLIDKYNSTHK